MTCSLSVRRVPPYLLSRSNFDVPGLFLHACARTDHSVSEIIIFKSAAGSISFRSAVSQSCRRGACNSRPVKVNKSIESDARGSFQQPRGPRGAGRWQQDGLVHDDAGQDRVSLGAPGPDLHLGRVRRPSRAKTAPLRPSPPHFFVFLD